MVPFVRDDAALNSGINKLVGRPGAASVLVEAIIDASERLAKLPSPRRAIVSLNIEPSNEQSREEPKKVNDALRKSRAQLWSVSLQKGDLRNPGRDVVLNAVTKNTGGTRDFINSPSALEGVLRHYADALTSQYRSDLQAPRVVGPGRPGRDAATRPDAARQRVRAAVEPGLAARPGA